MRVDFVIAGTQKGGTQALDAYLRQHPHICMPKEKEAHFFNTDRYFSAVQPDYDGYHALFQPDNRTRLFGESTPMYMYWQPAAERIWRYNPEMKLIVILRNPIERAYSHWNMERCRNAESLPFWEALQQESRRCRAALPQQHPVYSYVDRGYYLEQLRRLWRFFSPGRVLVLKNEQLRTSPQAVLNKVFRFLGLPPIVDARPARAHRYPYESEMGARERAYLRDLFEYEIKALERVLRWDCSDWLSDDE